MDILEFLATLSDKRPYELNSHTHTHTHTIVFPRSHLRCVQSNTSWAGTTSRGQLLAQRGGQGGEVGVCTLAKAWRTLIRTNAPGDRHPRCWSSPTAVALSLSPRQGTKLKEVVICQVILHGQLSQRLR
jgi:hypothetical protein